MSVVDPVTVLTHAYESSVDVDPGIAEPHPSAVISWPAVPIELVHAAGLRPVVVRGQSALTPTADAHLEGVAFPNRIRQLLEWILSGHVDQTACLVLPRTSEPDYKCFLYLRELVRRGVVQHSGPILLFDLLQSTGREVAAHNVARTRALFDALAAPGGDLSVDRVHEQITAANAARAGLRRLLALRGALPRIAGAEVLPLIGAFWQLAPAVYAPLAMAAADSLACRAPLEGPRVLLLGAPVDGPALPAAIERHGAVVVAEIGPWGFDAAGEDVAAQGDPFVAIAEKYRRDTWGSRSSVADCRRRVASALTDVDVVVVSLPPDDAVFGWDYLWLRELLATRRIPHICVTHEPSQPMPPADEERMVSVLSGAAPCVEARRG